MSFFEELKRRNVFRVGIGYAVLGWVVIQAADVIFPILQFPDWTISFVAVLAILGFPLALFLAWAFELTPEGIKREHEIDRSLSIAETTGRKLDFAIIGLLVVALGYFAYDKFVLDPAGDAARMVATTEAVNGETIEQTVQAPENDKSIAVLPFVNMSDDVNNEYFSDGISEELLNLLSRVPTLRVIARTSSFSYKGKDVPIAEIARDLNVNHVLEGSVRKSGNQVRITAQLIRANDSSHLWSESYDRTMEDIFTIQDEIASKVVAQLKIKLLGAATTVETADPAAYALFLQARQVGVQATPKSVEQSIVLIKQALEVDPEYAIAWATLADFYMLRRFMGGWDHGEIRTLAREAANHALSLDPTNATAFTALGLIAMAYDRDLVTAARHYGHALEFDPTNTLILLEALRLSRALGQTTAAIAIGEYLATVDPLNALAHVESGWAYFSGGRWDEAITTFRTALKLSPRVIQAHVGIGLSLLQKGEPEAALLAIQQELFEAYKQAGLVTAYHALGNETESDAVLAQFIENYGHNYAAVTAMTLSFRGEADRAFEQLDKAVQNIDAELIQLVAFGLFFEILNDPRWLPFLESIGMSPAQLAAIEFDVVLPE